VDLIRGHVIRLHLTHTFNAAFVQCVGLGVHCDLLGDANSLCYEVYRDAGYDYLCWVT